MEFHVLRDDVNNDASWLMRETKYGYLVSRASLDCFLLLSYFHQRYLCTGTWYHNRHRNGDTSFDSPPPPNKTLGDFEYQNQSDDDYRLDESQQIHHSNS